MRFRGVADPGGFIVSGGEYSHMVKTLRMEVGDGFTGIDGSGTDYVCEIEAVYGDSLSARVIETRDCPAEPKLKVTLYQAFPKGDRIESVLQKCVELGLFAFAPFVSHRCVKRPCRTDRLGKIAAEALKQCGRSRDVGILPLTDSAGVARLIKRHERAVLCYEEEDVSNRLCSAIEGDFSDLGLIIGPEGGFTEDEADLFAAAGAVRASLGLRILRADTAGIAALSAVMYAKGEL